MEYDSIILELLSRIKKLEDEVSALKRARQDTEPAAVSDSPPPHSEPAGEPSVTYRKMTDEMIDVCYEYGKRVYAGEDAQELAEEVSVRTGMNRNSAFMYLYVVSCMLDGTVFKRAINARALRKYLDAILDEYGPDGLRKALEATRLHISYRKRCGHTVDSIEEIYGSYSARLR